MDGRICKPVRKEREKRELLTYCKYVSEKKAARNGPDTFTQKILEALRSYRHGDRRIPGVPAPPNQFSKNREDKVVSFFWREGYKERIRTNEWMASMLLYSKVE